MGKVRVKTIGEEELEGSKKKKSYEQRQAEKRARQAEDATEEESVKTATGTESVESETGPKPEEKTVKKSKKLPSKRSALNAKLVDKNKKYTLGEALKLLKSFKFGSFDESVELHVNVSEKGVNGTISLPHGTGKQQKIVIADDKVIDEIEKGKIDFDVLIASPSLMPKLAKVAKVLGPRGLMPNPKNGTVTDDPKPLMEKLSKGQVAYKTEAKAPLIHMTVGKVSFDEKKLSDNITTVLNDIGTTRIKKLTISSTMSPGIKVTLN